MNVAIYLLLLSTCCAYALTRGGSPERVGVAILLAAIVASHFVPGSATTRFSRLETGLLAVDFVMLLCVLVLALTAQRYWPMWMAAVLVNTVITHLLMLTPELMPWSYSVASAAWSYPNPLILAVGSWRHQSRIKRYGTDPAWN
ncbi:hypothetical protein SAMN06297144_1200 [Sphingomonas guangdongensis]|uniref:Uncharacterized protein n=1 Tax=Sphingomonas guangdongensis TaxID=1141890 RepID=A0A285QFK8_9SPHN|nr:hypothetical protein [Sphingomonas guangdongensis]SOB80710.1 hypothetical protein SAMN06297144_1200 [Sphingomonas guangdongensis]